MSAPPLGALWSAFCVFFSNITCGLPLPVALLIRFCYWLLCPRLLLVSCLLFYRSVMTSWFRLPWRLENGEIVVGSVASSCCPLRSLTTRFAYRELSRLDAPEHRTVAKYSSCGLTVEWNTVWRNLSLWQFIRPIRDTNWLIAHGVLPTADRLLRFNINVDPLCHCGQPESLLHLFVECPFAKRLVAWYQQLVHRTLPQLGRPSTLQILVGYKQSVRIPPAFPCLLGIIRHRIWLAHNG